MTIEKLFDSLSGFDWDGGNGDKNKIKHKVEVKEAESVFFNRPLIVLDDKRHSQKEKRYIAFGKTNKNRVLIAAFTIRKNKIRIISIRDQNKKERRFYYETKN